MKKDPNVYLIDILQAAADIQSYIIGMDESDFYSDKLLQDGVIRKIAVIGEASQRLPQTYRRTYNVVPWKKIIGMRNIVVHDYDEINLKEVWSVAKIDLPDLVVSIQKILKERS